MNQAEAHFSSTALIATTLQKQLQQVQLPAAGGAAFSRVELFDVENLVAAFQTLLISEQRIAIIVPTAATWETSCSQQKILTRRVQPMTVLISDRILGDRTSALYGNSKNQGALNLAALAMPWIVGQLVPIPNGCISVPKSETVITLKDTARADLPGRACVAIELDCKGGYIEARTAAGITL